MFIIKRISGNQALRREKEGEKYSNLQKQINK